MSGENLRGYSGDMGAGKPPDLGWCSRCPKIGGLMANLSLAEVGALGISSKEIKEVVAVLTQGLEGSIARHPSARRLNGEMLAKATENVVGKVRDQVATDNMAAAEGSLAAARRIKEQIEELTKGCAGPTASGVPGNGSLVEWSCNSDGGV